MIDRRSLLQAGLAAPAVAAGFSVWARALADGAVTPPTLDELMRRPEVLSAALSPDGERIAILREQRQGDKRTAFLLIVKAADLGADPKTVVLGDFDVFDVFWGSSERLIVRLAMDRDGRGELIRGYYDGALVPIVLYRAMAIGADGSNPVILLGDRDNAQKNVLDLSEVVDRLPDDPDHILMQFWDPGHGLQTLLKVDIKTGTGVTVEQGTKSTITWAVQNGRAVLRYDSNVMNTVFSLYVRAPGEADWTFYRKVRAKQEDIPPEFLIVGVTPEPGVLLALDWPDSEDSYVVRKFDLKAKALGEVVVRQPGRDITELVVDRRNVLVGAAYQDDRLNYMFFEKGILPHYKGMNAFFENRGNVRILDIDDAHDRYVVQVFSPRQPHAYYLYDRKAARFDVLGESRPWLNGRLADAEIVQVKARDGLDLTAYLTIPITPSAGPRPMVVMPHGGPQVRDSLDYDRWAQALAARGWLVLQPNFRGSGGYGRAFAKAGHHHWGDAMQWDVEDCVAAVVASGKADPKRLAILGASYGGYAALMGAILKPDLYKAVVSRAGPSDLLKDLAQTRSQGGADSEIYDWWTTLMGDPAKDAAMLKAASPALRAAEMKAPVLLFHGTKDPVVDVFASRDMNAALGKAGKSVTYVEVKGEGHGGWKDEHEQDFLQKSADFIAQAFG
jgi:dipeptidyl aminopeptidase/acylaminoacyl peptidase